MAADPVAPPSAESVDSRTNFATLLSSSALDDAHAIMPGDRLSFRVIEDQEEMKLLLVKDSGQIEVPYYGLVSATNKTCRELAREVKSRLEQELYYQATVIIAVDQLTKSRGKVYLIGAIQTPGNQEIPGDEPLTVSKAVMRAGGFKEFADQRRVKVTRRAPGEGKRALLIEVDVAEVIEKGRPEKDLELTAGDVVFVPTRLVNF